MKYNLSKNGGPLYIQLFECIKADILSGRISDGEKLPSRRALAENLGLSKNTVELAYRKLIDEGYSVARSRSGYFARRESPINTDISEPDFYGNPGINYVMSQNGTDIDVIPTETLTKLCREIIYDNPELFAYGHKYGESALRKAISHNIYDLHGISCTPDKIVIGAGTDYLLQQLCCVLGEGGVFGFENPCFARSYVPIKNMGAQTRLIDTYMDRFPIEELYESDVNILYLSPDMHFPTARRLSEEQREELIAWAEAAPDRYIIEADFDLDFAENPGNSLLSLNPDKVIFLGTFYRSIAPSFSEGFLVLPDELKQRFDRGLPYYTNLKSRLEQQVTAEFITGGKYRSHTEKLRKLYKEKRTILKTALLDSPLEPYLKFHGADTGTYFILEVNNGMSEPELKSSANRHGVKLIPLSACLIAMNENIPKNSFVVGFGELRKQAIQEAAEQLIRAWAV